MYGRLTRQRPAADGIQSEPRVHIVRRNVQQRINHVSSICTRTLRRNSICFLWLRRRHAARLLYTLSESANIVDF